MRQPSQETSPRRQDDLPDSPPGSNDDLEDIVNTIVGHTRGDEWVRKRVRDLAIDFLAAFRDQTLSPTANNAVGLLEAVGRCASELADAWAALPEFLRDIIETRFSTQFRWDPEQRIMVKLSPGMPPREHTLRALAKAVDDQLADWRHPRTVNTVTPSKSGSTRAYERLMGDVRLFYAERVADLIARKQTIRAVTTSEDGDLAYAFGQLWTYTTGLPSEGYNLQDFVRHAAKTLKQQYKEGGQEERNTTHEK